MLEYGARGVAIVLVNWEGCSDTRILHGVDEVSVTVQRSVVVTPNDDTAIGRSQRYTSSFVNRRLVMADKWLRSRGF
jgi:hypothetical protein